MGMTDKEAMKLALFALDIVKIHYTQSRHINEAIAALKERLAQPEQEPRDCILTEIEYAHHHGWPLESQQRLVRMVEAQRKIPPAQPAQRTWMGLTDEEYFALQMKIKTPMISVQDYIDAMRMVEAKLKDKNNA